MERIAMHYDYDEISAAAEGANDCADCKCVVIKLSDGDTADTLVSTKWVFMGPGKVHYKFWPDGGVDVTPFDGTGRVHIEDRR